MPTLDYKFHVGSDALELDMMIFYVSTSSGIRICSINREMRQNKWERGETLLRDDKAGLWQSEG